MAGRVRQEQSSACDKETASNLNFQKKTNEKPSFNQMGKFIRKPSTKAICQSVTSRSREFSVIFLGGTGTRKKSGSITLNMQ